MVFYVFGSVVVFFIQLRHCATAYTKSNNVCKTFADYKDIQNNANCWYNPDLYASVPEMIERNNYPIQRYQAVTNDGFILTVFRIPKKKPKGVVYLQHPLTTASNVWVDKGNASLAFILSDAGYDVWMGNFRGTIYSQRHLYYSSASYSFWNHSYHELAIYDMPAQIDLIRKYSKTKDKIFYVGHSMGTTTAFIYSALLPNHAKENIKVFVELAPTAFMGNSKTPFKNFSFLFEPIKNVLDNLQVMNLIPHNGLIHNILKGFCFSNGNWEICLKTIIYLGMGPNFENTAPEWIPIAFVQNFAGFSVKLLNHYGQNLATNTFRHYDYGMNGNIAMYGTETPPDYPIENINVPHYLMYGNNDWISVPEDVERLYNKLPNEARKYGRKRLKTHNHYDAIYGRDSKEVIYEHIVYLFSSVIK